MWFDLNPPTLQKVRHAIRQASTTANMDFDLLSLPLYMAEEAERLFLEKRE